MFWLCFKSGGSEIEGDAFSWGLQSHYHWRSVAREEDMKRNVVVFVSLSPCLSFPVPPSFPPSPPSLPSALPSLSPSLTPSLPSPPLPPLPSLPSLVPLSSLPPSLPPLPSLPPSPPFPPSLPSLPPSLPPHLIRTVPQTQPLSLGRSWRQTGGR